MLAAVEADAERPSVVILVEEPDQLSGAQFEFVGHRGGEVHMDSVDRRVAGCIRRRHRSSSGTANEGRRQCYRRVGK